mmetsp:Transcript_9387/g.27053  ORF Transcript_9387/g.27053 Transcript_9387/m.27053 type:complete len:111 (-) Transcript_9387:1440-1772(-)
MTCQCTCQSLTRLRTTPAMHPGNVHTENPKTPRHALSLRSQNRICLIQAKRVCHTHEVFSFTPAHRPNSTKHHLPPFINHPLADYPSFSSCSWASPSAHRRLHPPHLACP